MAEISKSVGFATTIVLEDVPINIAMQYTGNSFSANASIVGRKLNLVTTVSQRFNDLNVVLPEGSGSIYITQLSGTVAKTGPSNKDREIDFSGDLSNISLPIPILDDINIDKAYFYYKYTSVAATEGNKPDLSGQVIFIGCTISLKGALATAVSNAKATGAYFVSNNVSLVYFNFTGTFNVGTILTAIFGGTFPNLTIDVKSAGIFRLAKQNPVAKGTGKKPTPAVPGMSYSDALKQITTLEQSTPAPTGDTKNLMPTKFPLSQVREDFTVQFNKAFSADDVTGISFWVEIDFTKITLFGSLITIGYSYNDVNQLVIYGYKTQTTTQKSSGQTSNSALFAQLPTIQLLDIFTFGGNDGRKGILFKYSSNNNQYELSGSVGFDPFATGDEPAPFLFEGDLTVNNDKLTAQLSISAGSPKATMDEPLGMTGVNFAEIYLNIDKTFAQPKAKPKPIPASLDLTIGGFINFDFNGKKLQFTGDLVFVESKPRLALVSLTATPALTLNDFVVRVIKKPWAWRDDVTKEIALLSGSMYYLKCPATKTTQECKTYTFSYTDPIAPKHYQQNGGTKPTPTVYKVGYHLDAILQLFDEYDFEIDLGVESDGIKLSGSYVNANTTPKNLVKVYFIELQSPALSIDTTGGASKFEISVDHLTLFGTDIGSFTMNYSAGVFSGHYSHSSPNFSLDWQWTKGNFEITNIDGLGTREVNTIAQMVKQLNSMNSGECSAVTNEMFNNIFKSKFSLALTSGQKPSKTAGGMMNVPLTITYKLTALDTLTALGTNIASAPINFSADVEIPTSVSNVPDAIWDTVTDEDNLNNIVGKILTNPETYKAIALEMAKKGRASLAARMLCKSKDEDGGGEEAEELAEELEDALKAGEIVGELGAILELNGVVVGVIAAGVAVAIGGLLGFLEEIWDKVTSWFSGGDSDKEKAQKKLDAIRNQVDPMVASIESRLKAVAQKIQIQHLNVKIDSEGDYNASWDFPHTSSLGQNGTLEYQFKFLGGAVGTHSQEQAGLSAIPASGFKVMNSTTYSEAWKTIHEKAPGYQMNASIQTTITGYTFMTAATKANLEDIIGKLDKIGDHLSNATSFASTLSTFVSKMDGYNTNGLTSSVVYAQLEDPSFTIGEGLLGINTKI